MKKIKQLLCVALGALLLTGCGKDKENEPARLSVEPAPGEISFGATDTKTYTYRVTTNQPQWSVQSDREWCVVTPDYQGGTFTVSARENSSDTAPEAATITVSAGRAASLTITATQQAKPIANQYDVYLAGNIRQMGSPEKPYRWKNGVMEELPAPAGMSGGQCSSITAANGSVYICGRLDDAAYYWKDDEYIRLPGYYATYSIAVENESVYVLGYESYWKDATSIPLEARGFAGNAITACDGVVYIAGEFTAGSHSAAYWTGGKAVALEVFSDEGPSSADCATASGGSVYFGGSSYDDDAGTAHPCYWKDEVRTTLTLPQESHSGHVWSICVENSKVYAAGYYIVDGAYMPCYWVDGKLEKLEVPENWTYVTPSGIAVADGAVYVGGHYNYEDENGNDYYCVCYWKDGKRFDSEVLTNLNSIKVFGIALLKK